MFLRGWTMSGNISYLKILACNYKDFSHYIWSKRIVFTHLSLHICIYFTDQVLCILDVCKLYYSFFTRKLSKEVGSEYSLANWFVFIRCLLVTLQTYVWNCFNNKYKLGYIQKQYQKDKIGIYTHTACYMHVQNNIIIY